MGHPRRQTMKSQILIAALAAAALSSSLARAAEAPPLVAAYVSQLAQQCGGKLSPSAALGLADRIDLNGDKLEDWIVDAGRVPCPTRSRDLASAGSQVTVFLARPDGQALPAFQRSAYGSNLERRPDGRYVLSMTLGASDCGFADAAMRCSRELVWLAGEQRFDLASVPLSGSARP